MMLLLVNCEDFFNYEQGVLYEVISKREDVSRTKATKWL
jgi:hypothetical protein